MPPPVRRAPEHPDVKADEEQGRAKPEEERRPGAAAFLDRLGADLDPVIDQECFQTRAHEGGERGREGGHRLGRSGGVAPPLLAVGLAFGRGTRFACRRVGDRCLEAARDGVAPAVNCLDVALPDLLLEQGIGHGDRSFRRPASAASPGRSSRPTRATNHSQVLRGGIFAAPVPFAAPGPVGAGGTRPAGAESLLRPICGPDKLIVTPLLTTVRAMSGHYPPASKQLDRCDLRLGEPPGVGLILQSQS